MVSEVICIYIYARAHTQRERLYVYVYVYVYFLIARQASKLVASVWKGKGKREN